MSRGGGGKGLASDIFIIRANFSRALRWLGITLISLAVQLFLVDNVAAAVAAATAVLLQRCSSCFICEIFVKIVEGDFASLLESFEV